jgi:hypothetical protein
MEFGNMIKVFLKERGMTFRGAGLASSISAAYWKDMSDGRVPSEEVIKRVSESFDGVDENELRLAAGYMPRGGLDAVTAVTIALRNQNSLPDEGKQQIVDFVKKIENKYRNKD